MPLWHFLCQSLLSLAVANICAWLSEVTDHQIPDYWRSTVLHRNLSTYTAKRYVRWTFTKAHALSLTQTWKWNEQDSTCCITSLPVRFDVEPFLLRLGLKTPSCMSTPPPTPPLSTWIVFGRGREPVDVLFRILGTGFVEARSTLSGRSLPYVTENVRYFANHSNTALSTIQMHRHQSQYHNCYFY